MYPISAAGGLDHMVQTETDWVRDYDVLSWANVEPAEGTRDWSAVAQLEDDLRTLASKGIKPILNVRDTPAWAQREPGYICGPIKPDKLGAFSNFVRDAVARYSAPPYNVKYWEIWNEPDIPYTRSGTYADWGCWGNPADPTGFYGGGYYATMLQAVYPQIKAADSQAQVLVGGLYLKCDPRVPVPLACPNDEDVMLAKFLQGILENGGGPYFDGVAFHAYDYYGGRLGAFNNPFWRSDSNNLGPGLYAKAMYVKQLLSDYGAPGKFLASTEGAILCDDRPQEGYYCATDTTFETTKAYYVVQFYAAAIAQGLRANVWFSVKGWRESGLLTADLSPRLAYTAYQFASNELSTATFAGNLHRTDVGGAVGVTGYKFDRPDRRIWVLWSLDGGSYSITLPGVPLAAWDALGNAVTPAISMTASPNPLYLEWNM